MRRLKVTHYLQEPCHCAVAACATIANYYNSEINYDSTKILVNEKIYKKVSKDGLESAQMCALLNELGFYKITYVTSVLDLVDYSWIKFGRKKMIEVFKKSFLTKSSKIEKENTKLTLKWLSNFNYDNKIVISYDFGKYIRQHLNRRKPVILTFNWTMFHKFAKDGQFDLDPYNGSPTEHAVVANGYDEKGVWIVDSHHQYYKYKRKKYRKGFYKISWENLMSCIGQGDVILPEDYYVFE